ncbi:UDP-glycosyltransferase 91C1 [Striga hermonthica]|uniref:UDP-glycosyltransferase 91C1 n=1 Tax=Striga hermonthica TaxID=68872 RepID=A0A9N7NEY5_STRHE|nr:UDP-glycosyltransferase 91C1 [Striga hermonthica]
MGPPKPKHNNLREEFLSLNQKSPNRALAKEDSQSPPRVPPFCRPTGNLYSGTALYRGGGELKVRSSHTPRHGVSPFPMGHGGSRGCSDGCSASCGHRRFPSPWWGNGLRPTPYSSLDLAVSWCWGVGIRRGVVDCHPVWCWGARSVLGSRCSPYIFMEEGKRGLHIVMFPWLAMGHIRPFFRLSVELALKGHRISFISTPANLQRAVKVPPHLAHLITLVSFPLPQVDHLPLHAESSMDVPMPKQQLLKVALDLLQPSVRSFLESVMPKPDWIVYDYASHWLPALAQEIGISTAFFSLFTAAFMAFLGPPSALIASQRSTAEDYTVVPDWITFPSNMVFRRHELAKNMEKDLDGHDYDSGTSDSIRFGLSIDGSQIVIFRSCPEFEPEWFRLVSQLYRKPVIPIGVLPPKEDDQLEEEADAEWQRIKEWLDARGESSVVYVALGSEVTLSSGEVHELALGLERCGSPFFWVLNNSNRGLEMLHQGMVWAKWAPQVRILGHPAVGGFLTHCGWNSVTEGLGFGRVLILLPVMHDQGMNARLLREKGVGLDIPRDEGDGSFTWAHVADTVRAAMVGEEGRRAREKAREMKELFGDESRSRAYVDNLVECMVGSV